MDDCPGVLTCLEGSSAYDELNAAWQHEAGKQQDTLAACLCALVQRWRSIYEDSCWQATISFDLRLTSFALEVALLCTHDEISNEKLIKCWKSYWH